MLRGYKSFGSCSFEDVSLNSSIDETTPPREMGCFSYMEFLFNRVLALFD